LQDRNKQTNKRKLTLHDWNNSRTKFRSQATTAISPWKSKLKLLLVEMQTGKRRMGLMRLGIASEAGIYNALVTMNDVGSDLSLLDDSTVIVLNTANSLERCSIEKTRN
jgi:hypothetical protein